MPRVREVMTPDPATASPSMSVVEVAKEMIQKKKGPPPVVEGGRVVAMVTDRDIIARVVAAGGRTQFAAGERYRHQGRGDD
jgi:CBS domain-containing protein